MARNAEIGEGGYPHGPGAYPGIQENWLGDSIYSAYDGYTMEGPGLEDRLPVGPYDATNAIADATVDGARLSQAPARLQFNPNGLLGWINL